MIDIDQYLNIGWGRGIKIRNAITHFFGDEKEHYHLGMYYFHFEVERGLNNVFIAYLCMRRLPCTAIEDKP